MPRPLTWPGAGGQERTGAELADAGRGSPQLGGGSL